MNWSDERYVRVYTRDTTDWLALSWQAQGLFCLLLRKVDRAGLLDLGRQGKAGLASHLGGPAAWRTLEPALEELLADGCVKVTESSLLIPNFIEAQEAKQTDKFRQAESRTRRREQARGALAQEVSNHDALSHVVTGGHELSHVVTGGHAWSQSVTPNLAVLSRAVPIAPTASAGGVQSDIQEETMAVDEDLPFETQADSVVEDFHLEAQSLGEAKPRKLTPAQNQREELRAMRAVALPGVVDDKELKPGALTSTFERLEREAKASGVTVRESYSEFLQDDYARSRNPPCPLPLFVDGNKFKECLSAALRSQGKGPPPTLLSGRPSTGRRAGSYASLLEIEAQDFSLDAEDGSADATVAHAIP